MKGRRKTEGTGGGVRSFQDGEMKELAEGESLKRQIRWG